MLCEFCANKVSKNFIKHIDRDKCLNINSGIIKFEKIEMQTNCFWLQKKKLVGNLCGFWLHVFFVIFKKSNCIELSCFWKILIEKRIWSRNAIGDAIKQLNCT